MWRDTASTSAGSQSKSGKPCDRLMAPRSAASFDMTVKIVVPTLGSFDCSIRVVVTAVPRFTGVQGVRSPAAKPSTRREEYLRSPRSLTSLFARGRVGGRFEHAVLPVLAHGVPAEVPPVHGDIDA